MAGKQRSLGTRHVLLKDCGDHVQEVRTILTGNPIWTLNGHEVGDGALAGWHDGRPEGLLWGLATGEAAKLVCALQSGWGSLRSPGPGVDADRCAELNLVNGKMATVQAP